MPVPLLLRLPAVNRMFRVTFAFGVTGIAPPTVRVLPLPRSSSVTAPPMDTDAATAAIPAERRTVRLRLMTTSSELPGTPLGFQLVPVPHSLLFAPVQVFVTACTGSARSNAPRRQNLTPATHVFELL